MYHFMEDLRATLASGSSASSWVTIRPGTHTYAIIIADLIEGLGHHVIDCFFVISMIH